MYSKTIIKGFLVVFSFVFLSFNSIYSQDKHISFIKIYEESLKFDYQSLDSIDCNHRTTNQVVRLLSKDTWQIDDLDRVDCLIESQNQHLDGVYYYLGGIVYSNFDEIKMESLFRKAYFFFESVGDIEGMFFSLHQLFNAQIRKSNTAEAYLKSDIVKLFEELVQLAQKSNHNLVNLSFKTCEIRKHIAFDEDISLKVLKKHKDFATPYINKYPKVTKKLLSTLGEAYQKNGKPQKALQINTKVLNLTNSTSKEYALYLLNIGDSHYSLKNTDSAIYYWKNAYKLSYLNNIIYHLSTKSRATKKLSEAYSKKNIDTAYYYLLKNLETKDKLTQLKLETKRIYADRKFELQKKDLQLAKQYITIKQKDKSQFVLISILFLGIFLGSVFFYHHYKVKKLSAQATKLVQQKDNLLRTLSHDLFLPLEVFATSASLLPKLISKGKYDDVDTIQKSLSKTIFDLQDTLNELFNCDKNQNTQTNLGIRKNVNLSKELSLIIDIYTNLSKIRNISINPKIDKNIHATIHFKEFGNLMRNLIFNAVKHSKPSSTIDIQFKESENHNLIFYIKNTFHKNELQDVQEFVNILNDKTSPKKTSKGKGLSFIVQALKVLNVEFSAEIYKDNLCITCNIPVKPKPNEKST